MERRVVVPRTLFEQRMANVITWIIAITVLAVALTLCIALLVVLGKAEFGIGVKRAVWQAFLPFVYILIGEVLVSIWLGRRVAIAASNMLSGPIRRITIHLKKIVDGETNEYLQIREGDGTSEMAGLINQLILKTPGR